MINKKADLSLSINAIVVLILAITMLGLGLTFMRGLFKQATEKVEAAVSAQELTNPPTIDNPLTVAPSELTLRKDKKDKITIAFLNTGAERICALSAPIFGIGAASASLTYNMNGATMKTDQINTWTVGVSAGATAGTDLFTLTMTCMADKYTKDIVILVTA